MTPRSVRLDLDLDDQICQISLHRGVSIHALMKEAIRRFVADERGAAVQVGKP